VAGLIAARGSLPCFEAVKEAWILVDLRLSRSVAQKSAGCDAVVAVAVAVALKYLGEESLLWRRDMMTMTMTPRMRI
jgi:hypothetical protein